MKEINNTEEHLKVREKHSFNLINKYEKQTQRIQKQFNLIQDELEIQKEDTWKFKYHCFENCFSKYMICEKRIQRFLLIMKVIVKKSILNNSSCINIVPIFFKKLKKLLQSYKIPKKERRTISIKK